MSPGGGKLKIWVGNEALDEHRVKAGFAPGDYVLFKVEDSGSGISTQNLPHIFEPFFTTKPINPTEIKGSPIGTGIGLRFCKNTIESYGGSISVDKCPEGGASFTLKIPLA